MRAYSLDELSRMKNSKKTIAFSYILSILEHREHHGAGLDDLLRQSNIPLEMLQKTTKEISLQQYIDLLSVVLKDTPSDCLATELIKTTEITQHGIIGLLVMCGLTVGAALKALLRFYRLQIKFIKVSYLEEDGRAIIRIVPDGDLAAAELFTMQISLMALLKAKQQLVGSLEHSDELFFACSESLCGEIVAYFPKNTLRFNQPYYQLSFPLEHLQLKLKSANKPTYELLLKQCESALAKCDASVSVEKQVASILEACLESFPSLQQMAEMLAVSSRTLSRRLKSHGLSYQLLLDQEKVVRAKELLLYTDMSITDISAQLYFSDASHFSKAFRRQVGITPTAYRQSSG